MQTLMYWARFEPGDKFGIVVTFPDVPEAITQGHDEADARAMAEEALGLALLTYPERGLPLPKAARRSGELVPIAVPADDAAKIAVLDAWRAAGISKSEFARRLGKDEKEARRILDPMHRTKLPVLTAALEALGRRLVVSVADVDGTPNRSKPKTVSGKERTTGKPVTAPASGGLKRRSRRKVA